MVPSPDHKCKGCNAPVYSKYPYCSVCFKEGKYPKHQWKYKATKPTKPTKEKAVQSINTLIYHLINYRDALDEGKSKKELKKLKKLCNSTHIPNYKKVEGIK